MLRRTTLPTLLSAAILSLFASSAWVADHEDGSIQQDRPADISDLHAFLNPNNGNVVLSMAVNGFSVPGFANAFSNDVLLQIKIDNTGDFVEDLVIQAVFEGLLDGQTVTVIGPARPVRVGAKNEILPHGAFIDGDDDDDDGDAFDDDNGDAEDIAPSITGPVGAILEDIDIKVFAGPTDDATWADLIFVESLLMGVPLGRAPGIDTVQGLNAATIAVEVPPDLLRGSTGNVIRVWATSSRQRTTKRSPRRGERSSGPWIQIDGVGIPALNPVSIDNARKDEFNRTIPSRQVSLFRDDIFQAVLRLNGGNVQHANAVADALLPDVLTLDMTSLDNFPNGRRPESDFVDVALGLLSNGAVTTDGLPANDVPFLDDFPFFAPAHLPEEEIPPRN